MQIQTRRRKNNVWHKNTYHKHFKNKPQPPHVVYDHKPTRMFDLTQIQTFCRSNNGICNNTYHKHFGNINNTSINNNQNKQWEIKHPKNFKHYPQIKPKFKHTYPQTTPKMSQTWDKQTQGKTIHMANNDDQTTHMYKPPQYQTTQSIRMVKPTCGRTKRFEHPISPIFCAKCRYTLTHNIIYIMIPKGLAQLTHVID